MKRCRHQLTRWAMAVAIGTLPAFVMRCDKAAINLQRGLFQGLGFQLGALVADQLPTGTTGGTLVAP